MQTKRGGKNMHLSFRAKISLTIITVSMAITCVLSMVFYQQSAQTVQENYTQAQMQQLTACAKLFDNTMLDAYSACVYAVNDEQLRESIQRQDIDSISRILDTIGAKTKILTASAVICRADKCCSRSTPTV